MLIKRQDLVMLFDGVDVLQSCHYIKLLAETYTEKRDAKHLNVWNKTVQMMAVRALPMPTNDTFMKAFTNAEGDTDKSKQQELQAKHKFGYQSGIGELIYGMITCRPDISTVTVNCAQHSAAPADIHFQGGKHAIKYVVAT